MSVCIAKLITIAACCTCTALGSAGICAAAPSGKLMDMLPQGFSTANCKEVDPTPPALERVMCEKSSDPNGPSHAVFLLYANTDDLAAALQGVGSSGYTVVSSCPGGQASPEKWSYGNSGQTAGQVECATSVENVATVIWTDNTKLRLGVVEGNGKDIAGLYNWWSAKS